MNNVLPAGAGLLPALFLSFFCGCSSTTAPESPSRMWTPPSQARPEQDKVWASLRAQKVDRSKPLALVELMDIAVRGNPDTVQAWENARAADAARKQARSTYYPTAIASGTGSREKGTTPALGTDIDQLDYGPSIKITWLLLDIGGRSAQIEQASRQLLQANFLFNKSLQDLYLAVEKGYHALHSAKESVEAAKSSVEDAQTTLDAAEQKLDAGLATRLDVLEAQSDLDKALYTLESSNGDVESARAALAKALGIIADTPFEIAAPTGEIPTSITGENVTRLIDLALDKRPDVAASRAGVRAYEAALRSANSDLWPTLNLGGTAQKNWHEYYAADTAVNDDYEYMGALTLQWTLFDGFYNIQKKRSAAAKLAAERAKLRSSETAAGADVWTSFYTYKTAVQKLKFSEAYHKSSQTSYDLAMESYNAGLKSMLDLLHAQSKLADARSQLVGSRKDVFVALATLAHSTGSLLSGGGGMGRLPAEAGQPAKPPARQP